MFLLTYDIYMSEEKMKEILPQAQIKMRCLLNGYELKFFNQVLGLIKSQKDETASAVIWSIEENDIIKIEEIYPKESYDKSYFHIKIDDKYVNDDILTAVYIPKNTATMLPTNEYIEDIIKAYGENNFDFCCIEYALDNIKFNYESHD
ncbi:hypothetical protein B5E58_11330 [Tyzzerella sp. An114]|uniref:hypothetical protein n=1 Tax=Tyzzerella sp. An114 TaxID=1965545 RepID=UPI000B42FE07|nr:hypothetical protein [Tyzzerella sp. An114]OUQ56122.1 hypothetical protein B5E58_11330 [Tyzzerella sp. An114]